MRSGTHDAKIRRPQTARYLLGSLFPFNLKMDTGAANFLAPQYNTVLNELLEATSIYHWQCSQYYHDRSASSLLSFWDDHEENSTNFNPCIWTSSSNLATVSGLVNSRRTNRARILMIRQIKRKRTLGASNSWVPFWPPPRNSRARHIGTHLLSRLVPTMLSFSPWKEHDHMYVCISFLQ